MSHAAEYHDDIIYPNTIAFILVHLAPLAAFWSGVTTTSVILAITLYVVRMFGITAGYHRYFSHRSFKTSRLGQFLFALLAMSSTQKSVLWWAALHRHHHRHSDEEDDVHSPLHRGFFYSHVGWIFDKKHDATRVEEVPDLAKYPELRFLDRHQLLPAIGLAILCFAIDGWSGLFIGFFASTAVLYHGTFFINSLAHVHGSQRYVTGDTSRNNWWLAVITLGEGWHNNHHAYQRSTRQGFRWYEFDPTYYALKVMSWLGLVWDLGEPPAEVVRNERRLGAAVLERVSRQLAEQYAQTRAEAVTALQHARDHFHAHPKVIELRARLAAGQARAEESWHELQSHLPHLPALPSLAEVRARVLQAYADSPSTDEIAARVRQLLAERWSAEVFPELGVAPA
ncbi:MAG: acyl-CoA desaturase [Gemmatimonadaceae bacterium]|nr:acyl-CoA desaturase [Gemmatimonadaceae bacterium]MCW5826999.1 acyl-CoA desaturase [Gemmatimonadaceae bacterium]